MKKKNVALIVLICVIVVIGLGTVIYRVLQDENQLTITEKKYVTDKKSSLISVSVLNDANVFGSTGTGVYYDYLNSFEQEYGLSFNVVTTSVNNNETNLSLTKGSTLPNDAKLFYTDHYVLISKKSEAVSKIKDINGTIGVTDRDLNHIRKFLDKYSLAIKNYDSRSSLTNGLENEEVNYILVPRIEYLDYVLDKLYVINYHLSDIKDYYYMKLGDDEVLSSILKKFYNVWSKDNFTNSFNSSEFELFKSKLKITEKELAVIDSKTYTYGFIENAPYDSKVGGTYGGINNMYLKAFSSFSGISFEYKEYGNLNKLFGAVNKEKIDLFMNYYDVAHKYSSIDSNHSIDISFVMNNNDERSYTSIESITGETIYAKEYSIIATYLKNSGLNVSTYKSDKELKKVLKNNNIVAMDRENYLIYREDNKNVSERFVLTTKNTYNFASHNDTMFNRLFSYYIMTIDKNEIIYTGLSDYKNAIKSGTIIYKITKYAAIIVVVITVITLFVYRLGKSVHIKKKIKRTDKMKYIDMLTSLKNRNFLSENLSIWNQNTIYPQAIVVIDLNDLQELNDTYGYQEGDKQIQSAANALIKTQLDNSEIMRTDGNEFTIYLVGYNEKQVLSYIKKLNKEFKNLPHDKGAAIGFSMIEDDVKLIDDAINEATERMRENKELFQGESDEEKI